MAWLRRYQNALQRRRYLAQRLAEARSAAGWVSPCRSGVRSQSRDGASPAERAVERIEEARQRLFRQELACKALYAETMRAILALPNAREREVLRRRYLRGQRMEQISAELAVSRQFAHRLHKNAIQKMELDSL